MTRWSHDRSVQTDRTSKPRRTTGGRALTLGTLAMVSIIVLTACGPEVNKPYSHISPASPTTDDIQSLYQLVFWLALVVFIGVQFAIVYTALRFRRMKHSPTRPPQVHGNRRLEILWTIIPAVVLLAILIPTITTLYDWDAAAEEGDIVVDVYGRQWWWEVHYGEDRIQGGQNLDVITANELHLPEGREAIIRLHSNNVIHSFWVPRLSGKMDLIPGHVNRLSITPTQSGEYFGECAEFCGTQHAWMRFKIVVQPEEQFYGWVNAQRAGNLGSINAQGELPAGVTRAPAAFGVCLGCHVVNGVNQETQTGLEAPRNLGPNLTNLACRDVLAAGLLINNEENLREWIDNPGGVKPGNYMADVITPGLIREQYGDEGFNELIEYLRGLQPAQGCNLENPGATPVGGVPASPVASPVGSPVAGSNQR